jgi:hypothetical protein
MFVIYEQDYGKYFNGVDTPPVHNRDDISPEFIFKSFMDAEKFIEQILNGDFETYSDIELLG